MKNKILAVLLLCVLALGAVSAGLWRQLQAARQELAQVQLAAQAETEARAQQADKIKQLEAQRARLGQDVDQFTTLVNSLRAKESSHASNYARLATASATTSAGGATSADADKGGLFGGKGMGDMLSKMMKDPAMKEMMRSQQKVMVQKMYGPLLKDLNLAPEEKDRFMALVLDHQLAAVDQAGTLFGGGDKDKTEVAATLKDKEKEMEANLKALLGDDKFAQYTDYKGTMGDRLQLDQLKQQLDGSGTPLQDDQLKSLLGIMKEERDKVPPVVDNKAANGAADFAKMLTDDSIEKQFQWQQDLNRRVLERAGQVLSPQQLKEYTDFQSQQLNMQKAGMKMAREMFGSGSKTPSPDANPTAAPTQ